MSILIKAIEFAINAHKGQLRKTDSERPAIVHPMNVANMLKEYGFDDEVVAAGYLHDVIEDTKHLEAEIGRLFGKNILSLVKCASEPYKELSWEERKQHTIDFTKDLDLRHKAVICVDKISNLEDIMIFFGTKGEQDFSTFKRGFEDQKKYFEGIYKSLITGQDENHPMFIRLKGLIEHVFNNVKEDEYIKNVVFKGKEDEYEALLKLHFKKKDVKKLSSIISIEKPYVIEFTGTARTGKTTLISNLYDFFKKGGFSVALIEEFTTSKKFKEELFPSIKDKSLLEINTIIPRISLQEIDDASLAHPDIIIVDRSLLDRLVWIDRLYVNGEITEEEYQEYKNLYVPIIKDKIDIIIGTHTDGLTAVRRDYGAHLSLENRRLLNEHNVDDYNNSLFNVEKICIEEGINFHLFDTTSTDQREISFNVTEVILRDMKRNRIEQIKTKILRNNHQ